MSDSSTPNGEWATADDFGSMARAIMTSNSIFIRECEGDDEHDAHPMQNVFLEVTSFLMNDEEVRVLYPLQAILTLLAAIPHFIATCAGEELQHSTGLVTPPNSPDDINWGDQQ